MKAPNTIKNALISLWRDLNAKVAMIAVNPSSPPREQGGKMAQAQQAKLI